MTRRAPGSAGPGDGLLSEHCQSGQQGGLPFWCSDRQAILTSHPLDGQVPIRFQGLWQISNKQWGHKHPDLFFDTSENEVLWKGAETHGGSPVTAGSLPFCVLLLEITVTLGMAEN